MDPTVALIVEIGSPRDDSWEKLPFYAAHEVDEVVNCCGQEPRIQWLGLQTGGDYRPLEQSRVLGVSRDELALQLD